MSTTRLLNLLHIGLSYDVIFDICNKDKVCFDLMFNFINISEVLESDSETR